MILGTRKRFLFVHIPKCAGESITALLLNPLNGGTEWLRKHSTYRDAAQTLGHELKTFTVFTVVRNPFAQVFSFYEHLRKPLWMTAEQIEAHYPERLQHFRCLAGKDEQGDSAAGCGGLSRFLRSRSFSHDSPRNSLKGVLCKAARTSSRLEMREGRSSGRIFRVPTVRGARGTCRKSSSASSAGLSSSIESS